MPEVAEKPAPDHCAAGRGRWTAALRVAELIACEPAALGGVVLRARPGPALDRWMARLRGLSRGLVLRMPPEAGDDRLIGGLDLAATLAAGRPVLEPGVLARADGGLVVVPGADRLTAATAARIAAALDRGAVGVARDGFLTELPARLGVVLIDEGEAAAAAAVPAALADRVAFHVDLEGLSLAELGGVDAVTVEQAADVGRCSAASVAVPGPVIAALCEAAARLGIGSQRAVLLAVKASQAIAAAAGRAEVDDDAAREAAALVLAPRACAWPESHERTDQPTDQEGPRDPPSADDAGATPPPGDAGEEQAAAEALTETVIAAVRAALPADLLAELTGRATTKPSASGRSQARTRTRHRGRQVGVDHGLPRGGARLDVLATLRAAAPWQRVRTGAGGRASGAGHRIAVRREDCRIRRFEQAAGVLTIFAVDASGSAALHRLGEAKGAVELLLADCYVRRDAVALVAFRGTSSAVELPPTRSLARARRLLAGLPGGGGTPLADALLSAGRIAEEARRRGEAPAVVILTDCRANVALDGKGGHAAAESDALRAAAQLRARGLPALLVDTSSRPQPFADQLRAALGARYLALPHGAPAAVAAAARELTAR